MGPPALRNIPQDGVWGVLLVLGDVRNQDSSPGNRAGREIGERLKAVPRENPHALPAGCKERRTLTGTALFPWRRMGDSNPRGLSPNTLSKRAP